MRVPDRLRLTLLARARAIIASRHPDFVLDGYLDRWHLLPRNALFNIYLHRFRGSDDDRALHDHPYPNVTLMLEGYYWEHTPRGVQLRGPGDVALRSPWAAHRVVLEPLSSEAVTLFVTGPRVRTWGFYLPNGWVPWYEFPRR